MLLWMPCSDTENVANALSMRGAEHCCSLVCNDANLRRASLRSTKGCGSSSAVGVSSTPPA